MRMNSWLLGSAVVVGVLLLATTAKAATAPNFFRSSEEDDLDALASMLIAETSFAHGKPEMAQIVFIAVNRARRWGVSIPSVVAGPQPSGCRVTCNGWNNATNYKNRFAAAPRNSRWLEAREFAREVLAGSYANLGHMKFIHPGGMPTPPCSPTASGAQRVQASTIAGERCIPTWAVGGRVVGKGMFA
jgi:hypothetical protein